ncbi:hypothetical protein [Faunimonas sp. B44]|uniref:hypothetical protein n=1 Tax=Faunimonas sp. B44 TaxID=3461493 RepID=UPI004043A68A
MKRLAAKSRTGGGTSASVRPGGEAEEGNRDADIAWLRRELKARRDRLAREAAGAGRPGKDGLR